MREPGHIYILVNPSIAGLLKIGKTTRNPESRAKELSQATGVATPFYVAYSICVEDCHSAEDYVHALLENTGFKRTPNREFFQMPLRKAIEVLLMAEDKFKPISTPDREIGSELQAESADVDSNKPKMLAAVFAGFVRGKIDLETFRRLAAAIDLGFLDDLKALADMKDIPPEQDHTLLANLVRTGLAEISMANRLAPAQARYESYLTLTRLGKEFMDCMNHYKQPSRAD